MGLPSGSQQPVGVLMTIADSLKQLAYNIRAIPGQFGIRPYTVSVVSSTFANDDGLTGTETITTTAITEANGQPPKVRWLNSEELTVSDLESGTIEVGPITPDTTAGTGTLLSLLTGSGLADGSHLVFIVTGPKHPNGARYRRVDDESDRALHYTLKLSPIQGS